MNRAAQRLEVNWWRSQGVRFFMRWPSAYLCHLLNLARHQTYGLEAAATVLKDLRRQLRDRGPLSLTVPREMRRRLEETGQHGIQAGSIQPLSVRHCTNPSEGEPFLPGPIIRVHVRGSDKAFEMKLFPFEEYLRVGDALRDTALPRATRLWLSSEEKVRPSCSYSSVHHNVLFPCMNYRSWQPCIMCPGCSHMPCATVFSCILPSCRVDLVDSLREFAWMTHLISLLHTTYSVTGRVSQGRERDELEDLQA